MILISFPKEAANFSTVGKHFKISPNRSALILAFLCRELRSTHFPLTYLVLVAAGVPPAVEGARPAARTERWTFQRRRFPSPSGDHPSLGPPGETPRLYSRRDARCYGSGVQCAKFLGEISPCRLWTAG